MPSPGPACRPASVRVMHTCERAEMGVTRLPCSTPRPDAGCHPLLHMPTKNAAQHWLETCPPRPPPPPYPGAPPQTARSRSTGRSRPQTARWPSRAPAGRAGRTVAADAMHESGATSYCKAAHTLIGGKSKRAMQTGCARKHAQATPPTLSAERSEPVPSWPTRWPRYSSAFFLRAERLCGGSQGGVQP